MYLTRDIETTILTVSKSFPAIAIYGARQIGKSTTLYKLFGSSFNVVTLDDTVELELALSNPKGFLEVHPWPLIIDEVQKAPKLLNEIKIIIDKERYDCLINNKKRKLMYVLSSSNQFILQQGISESLAGRIGIIEMYSMTQLEAISVKGDVFNPNINILLEKENKTSLKYANKLEIFKRIYRGGMPDVVTNESEHNTYFKSYLDTYLEKDVRNLISASSEMQFRRFMAYLALRTATEINYEVYARELGIDSATCKRWISILQTSGIIYLLEPYMAHISKRIIKAPKLYFMDTGLCAYLAKWPNSEMLEACAMGGQFFETFVISEIIKSLANNNINPKEYLYYYRDIDQREIDVLFIKDNEITPIEIKKSETPNKPTKNFKVLKKYNLKINRGLIINTSDKIRPINENAYVFPVYLLGL